MVRRKVESADAYCACSVKCCSSLVFKVSNVLTASFSSFPTLSLLCQFSKGTTTTECEIPVKTKNSMCMHLQNLQPNVVRIWTVKQEIYSHEDSRPVWRKLGWRIDFSEPSECASSRSTALNIHLWLARRRSGTQSSSQCRQISIIGWLLSLSLPLSQAGLSWFHTPKES